MGLRIGYGIDFHQLVTGRDLFIGGIKERWDTAMRMYCCMPFAMLYWVLPV
jgi:hypothetical protein